ncbi:hypothetical protein KI387_037707, partial [Taxus chinensis]
MHVGAWPGGGLGAEGRVAGAPAERGERPGVVSPGPGGKAGSRRGTVLGAAAKLAQGELRKRDA